MINQKLRSSIIIPTYNEAENLKELIPRIRSLLPYTEIIVVDDNSPDGTADVAWNLGCKATKRMDERGLASAVLDGLRTVEPSNNVVIMDADLQHDVNLLPILFDKLQEYPLVIASRYCKGGGIDGWDRKRKIISLVANLLALPLTPKIRDRTTGYFGFSHKILQNLTLDRNIGYKVGLEIFVKASYDSFIEIPYTFKPRHAGASKFNRKQTLLYIKHLVKLYLHKFSWLKFGMVGGTGVVVHLGLLYLLTDVAHLWYIFSAILSIIAASTSNYFLNHFWTFSDRRAYIKSHLRGWFKYQCVSAVTDGLYIGLLALFVEVFGIWYMLSAMISILIVFIVKFKVAKNWIWGRFGK